MQLLFFLLHFITKNGLISNNFSHGFGEFVKSKNWHGIGPSKLGFIVVNSDYIFHQSDVLMELPIGITQPISQLFSVNLGLVHMFYPLLSISLVVDFRCYRHLHDASVKAFRLLIDGHF